MTEAQLTFDIEADEQEMFLEEVEEHLEGVDSGILRLEDGADPDTINSVFRAAHTLKALAGTVGHHKMAELTHTMETLFDAMRGDDGLVPTPTVIDDLLVAVDILKSLRTEFITLQPSGVDVDSMLARLRMLLEQGDETTAAKKKESQVMSLTAEQASQVEKHRADGSTILEIEVAASEDFFAPSARLLQAAMALMEVGDVIVQSPTTEDLSSEQAFHSLWLILTTRCEASVIEEILDDISDLDEPQVRPYVAESKPSAESTTKPSPSSAPAVAGSGTIQSGEKTVRISVERLDTLMNLVGELVTNRVRLLQIGDTLLDQHGKEGMVGSLNETTVHFGRVVDQLQEEVMRARMLPIANLFSKFPRLVRDVARATGKEVDLEIDGEATELDRSLIEAIGDPLVHLIRNAVDHGVEPPDERVAAGKPRVGKVLLTAAPVEGQIVITVEDDGQGINSERVKQSAVKKGMLSEEEAAQLSDEEAVDLIFLPNLSTTEQLTEVSGRGVGMDVVRTNVEKLNGSVVIESVPGKGSVIRVTLPLTLAIVETMLVALQGAVYAIPISSIIDSTYLSEMTVNTVKGSPTISWRESVLPLLDMRKIFANPRHTKNGSSENGDSKLAVVTVTWGKMRAGLVVDQLIGKQEVVIKSLSPFVGDVPGLSGGAILGDGRIALILDIPSLVKSAMQARRQVAA